MSVCIIPKLFQIWKAATTFMTLKWGQDQIDGVKNVLVIMNLWYEDEGFLLVF